MELEEFLSRTGISQAELAARCGLTYHQLTYILRGKTPKLKISILLSDYSKSPQYKLVNGVMEPFDFLSVTEKMEVRKFRKEVGLPEDY